MTQQMKKLYGVANDLGNAALKWSIKNVTDDQEYQEDKIPSVIAMQRPQNYEKPMRFNNMDEQDYYFDHLEDYMDITITSPSVKTQGRMFVGTKAIDSGLPTRMFDINDYAGKSQSDLSLILTLSRIATQVIKDEYKLNGTENLNSHLSADVIMTTALPIKEGKQKDVIDNYKNRYTKGKHLVNIYNFDQPITVELNFVDVYVGLEGEMAQFKIKYADEDLKAKIKKDFDESYPQLKDEITAEDLTSVKNVLGIDIGDGTTDKPITTNGKANANASTSLPVGYGSVLQDAVAILQDKGMNIASRGDLNSFLSTTPSPFVRDRYNLAKEVVNEQLSPLVDQIIDSTSETMRNSKTGIDLVFVYGGGSIPLREHTNMRDQLVSKLKGFSGGLDIPVVWIDPTRAQTLNEDGLQMYLDHLITEYQNDKD